MKWNELTVKLHEYSIWAKMHSAKRFLIAFSPRQHTEEAFFHQAISGINIRNTIQLTIEERMLHELG